MAKLQADFGLLGSLQNLSFYKRWDSDKIIVRTKGGASKDKIKTSPRFERTRENNAEFGGRGTASSWVMEALWPQKALADYNIAGSINSLLRPVQMLDTEGRRGQRHIMLSKNPRVLEGFSLNRRTGLDSIIRSPMPCSLSRETFTAQINIPALQQNINFFPPPGQSMYGIIAVLGVVPDLFYSGSDYKPSSTDYKRDFDTVATEWFPVVKGSPAQTLQIQIDSLPPNSDFSLMLSIGIRFGVMIDAQTVQQVPRKGAAKVLAMA